MGAYEELASTVRQQYDGVLRQQQATAGEELPGATDAIPAIRISGSKPTWLADGWRKGLALASLIGTAVGLLLLATPGWNADNVSVGFAGAFAIVSLVIAYFTVAGFGTAEFSIGSSGSETANDVAGDRAPKND